MCSGVREGLIFQMAGGCCLRFALQFRHLLCYHRGISQTSHKVMLQGSAAASSAQASGKAKGRCGAGSEASMAGAWEAAQL